LIDDIGNTTAINYCVIKMHTIPPSNLSLNLIGSDGSSYYTGFYEKYGRFFPSDFIRLEFSANSPLPKTYKISGDI
jgi:hypothetical protein